MRPWLLAVGGGLLLLVAGCGTRRTTGSVDTAPPAGAPPTAVPARTPSAASCAAAGGWGTCDLGDRPDRPYDLRMPAGYDPAVAYPVVLVFHGGGGSASNAETMTCPEGDRDDPACLQGVGDREGFVTVFPNGSGFPPARRFRTWNAGGGTDGWNCTSGRACAEGVDDMAYVDAVLDDLARRVHVDPSRVYAVGLSNGAALVHRLACERSTRVAAVVAVAGSNQFATTAPCRPRDPVAVMEVHGTEDPCWTYETSERACADRGGRKLGAVASASGWAERLACTDVSEAPLPDVVDDGTATTVRTWSGCAGGVEVALATVEGGGHTWPNGDPALPERRVGRVTRDWGNEVVWGFLRRFAR